MRKTMRTSQSSGLPMTSVLYGGRKKKLNERNAEPARERPSNRPPAELPPNTTRRYANATCALSSWLRNTSMSPVAATSAVTQTSHWVNVCRDGVPFTSPLQLEAVSHRGLGSDQLRPHWV